VGVSDLQHLCMDASALETGGGGGVASIEKRGEKVV
jgi:hypothetical protein